jgi:hypothetical protein
VSLEGQSRQSLWSAQVAKTRRSISLAMMAASRLPSSELSHAGVGQKPAMASRKLKRKPCRPEGRKGPCQDP